MIQIEYDGNMEDLCPLCSNNGRKRCVKLFQVNLQEAVRVCEEDECPWPFGFQPFTFSPRIVGKTWSYYWNDYSSSKPKEFPSSSSTKQQPPCSKPFSIDLPVTPQTPTTNHHQTNIFCEENEEKPIDHNFHVALPGKPGNKEFHKNSAEPRNDSLRISNSFESICIDEDIEEVTDEITKQKRNANSSKMLPVDRSPSVQSVKLLPIACNGATQVESSMNTTEVKIEGLPPIKLSYQISSHPKAAPDLAESIGRAASDGKSSAIRNTVAKRNLTSGKQYAKFSFCSIKKTLGTVDSITMLDDYRGDGNCSRKVSLGQGVESEGSGKSNSLVQSSTELSKNSCVDISEDSWTKTDSVNLDTVLDDFLSGNCGDGKDVNDDWINSLLT